MVEYLYNCIRASAGQDITIISNIEENKVDVTEGCGFMLHIDEDNAIVFGGEFKEGLWYFTIPAEYTKELKGRYWYCLTKNGSTLCFKQPIYFM